MSKISTFFLAATFVFSAAAHADDTYEQRQTFREDMGTEARDNYAGFQQFSDEGRDLRNQGWTQEQIRSKQQAEYNARHLPPQSRQQGSGDAGFAAPPAGANASFSGFSTPQSRKKDPNVQGAASSKGGKKDVQK